MFKNNIIVSVIVPVYNVEKYLKRCIDSILMQTYRNLEIILVDDGSTDNSGSICDQYGLIDSRIKVIHKIFIRYLFFILKNYSLHLLNLTFTPLYKGLCHHKIA